MNEKKWFRSWVLVMVLFVMTAAVFFLDIAMWYWKDHLPPEVYFSWTNNLVRPIIEWTLLPIIYTIPVFLVLKGTFEQFRGAETWVRWPFFVGFVLMLMAILAENYFSIGRSSYWQNARPIGTIFGWISAAILLLTGLCRTKDR